MLGAEESAELAEDIRTNGLRHPIVTYQGMILDGRNRHAGCLTSGTAPRFVEFDGDDDAALAFVQSANNARRHQSRGSLAASWALSMLAAEKRDGGRWEYGANSRNSEIRYDMLADLGVIADHAPDLLVKVRDDEMSLNAALRQAEESRDAERNALAEQERIEAEETDARARLAESAPEYLDRFPSARVALAAWEDDNRAEAARIRQEKATAQRKAAEHRKAMTHTYSTMARGLQVVGGYGKYEDVTELMAEFSRDLLDPPQYEREFSTENLRNGIKFLNNLIDWQETRNV